MASLIRYLYRALSSGISEWRKERDDRRAFKSWIENDDFTKPSLSHYGFGSISLIIGALIEGGGCTGRIEILLRFSGNHTAYFLKKGKHKSPADVERKDLPKIVQRLLLLGGFDPNPTRALSEGIAREMYEITVARGGFRIRVEHWHATATKLLEPANLFSSEPYEGVLVDVLGLSGHGEGEAMGR